MIDALHLPPKPAILRMAEPWEVRAHADMERLRIPLGVRLAVVAELRRLQGSQRSIVRAAASDLERFGKLPSGMILGGMILNPYVFVNAASSVTYLGQSPGDSVGGTSEDVTIDLGTAHAADKIVVVITQANWAGSNSVPSSVTIDGQTGVSAITPIRSASETGSIWYFDDASGVVGGSSTINMTFADAEQPQIVAAYRLVNVVTGGPTTNNTHTASSSTTSTLSLNVTANAILIAGSQGRRTGDDDPTWNGANEDNDTAGVAGEYQCSTASLRASSTETPRTLTCVWSASQTRLVGVAATWNSL